MVIKLIINNNEHKTNFNLPNDKLQLFLYLFGIYCVLFGIYLFSLIISSSEIPYIADQVKFEYRADQILKGKIPFISFNPTRAAPLSGYLWTIPVLFSNLTGIPRSVCFRLFFMSANIVSSLMLYSLIREESFYGKITSKFQFTNSFRFNPFLIALIYSLNPFSIHLAIGWGSDETVAALLIILPCWLIKRKKKRYALSAIAIGTGIKYFTFVLFPIFMFDREIKSLITRVFYSASALAMSILVYFPFYWWGNEKWFDRQLYHPITEGGNQGILTVIAELNWYDIDSLPKSVKWSIIAMFCAFLGVVMLFKKVNDPFISAGGFLIVFLIVYPKYQYSYLMMVNVFIVPFIFKSNKHFFLYVAVFAIVWFDIFFAILSVGQVGFLGLILLQLSLLIYWTIELIIIGSIDSEIEKANHSMIE